MTKLVVSHFMYRMTSQIAVPTSRTRANDPSTLYAVVFVSVFIITTIPRMMLPSSDHAGSAKYHQCGCMSRAIVSLAFKFFLGNGMNATVVTARRSGRDNERWGRVPRSRRRIVSP